jgi:hypothetical protein
MMRGDKEKIGLGRGEPISVHVLTAYWELWIAAATTMGADVPSRSAGPSVYPAFSRRMGYGADGIED